MFQAGGKEQPNLPNLFLQKLTQGGTGYKANTEMETGKAKYLSVQVNFGIQSNFIHALCE